LLAQDLGRQHAHAAAVGVADEFPEQVAAYPLALPPVLDQDA